MIKYINAVILITVARSLNAKANERVHSTKISKTEKKERGRRKHEAILEVEAEASISMISSIVTKTYIY
jgi:hypothetical protein